MTNRSFILKQDLFLTPKGSIFNINYEGTYIMPYDLYRFSNTHRYTFSITDVEKHPEWFEEIEAQSGEEREKNRIKLFWEG